MNPTNGPNVTIKTTVDVSEGTKQIQEMMVAAARSFGSVTKEAREYRKTLKTLINDLEGITRAGSNAGQTIRDLSLVAGGTVDGRVRQANQRAKKAAITQTAEVLTSDLINFQAGVHAQVAKSLKSAMRVQLAKNKQEMASLDAEIRAAQIEAQRTRVGFANQLHGARGNVRGTITENANAVGIQNLGTRNVEQAALDKLLATDKQIKEEMKLINKEVREREQLEGRIAQLTNTKHVALRRELEIAQKSNALQRESARIAQLEATGNQSAAIKAKLKQEGLRLDLLALRGVKEENAEWQKQLQVIHNLHTQQLNLNAEKQKGNKLARETDRLERSRLFAQGKGIDAEIARNQMIGGRRNASSLEGRASLLGMQGNLLMNYGLLGGGVAALHGMTSGVVELDAKLRELQAIAGATNGQFESLRSVVIKTSEDTKFSAVELAESATMLAQVGQSAEEIENTLPVISAFAMAVGTDMKNAVDIVTTSLTVFNFNSSETQRITNILAEALNRSKLSMDQLVLGFQYSANIAADAGVTFEELTAVLAGMSQAGIRSGSMLGTGLRQILMSLAAPTEKITQLLSDLGLTTNDVDVRTQGLTGVLENLAKAGLTASQAMGAFETRTAAALVASTNQVDFIRQVQEQFTFTRAAEEAAAKQSEAFKNSMLELKNEFMSFVNDAARPVLQMMISVAKTMKDAGNSIGPMIPLIKALGTSMIVVFGTAAIASVVKLGAAFLSFSGILGGVKGVLASTATAHTALTLAMTATGTAGARLSMIMTAVKASMPVLGVISLLAAGLVGFSMALNQSSSSAETFKKKLDEQRTAMEESRAKVDQYMQVLDQIDATLARVRDRSARMKDGTNELRLEIMQSATAFNQYGAGIDATNVKLDDYILRLKQARDGVLALAEAQAQENYEDAKDVERTERGGFSRQFLQLQNRFKNDANLEGQIRQLGLSEADVAIALAAVKTIKEGDALTTDTGQLANISNAGSNLSRLLRGTALESTIGRPAQNVGFAAGSANAAISNANQAGVVANGLALMRSPRFVTMQSTFTRLTDGFGAVEQELADLARQRSTGALSVGDYNTQRSKIINDYGARYRNAESGLANARDAFMENTTDPTNIYAFNKIFEQSMEPVTHMKNLLARHAAEIDEMQKNAITVISGQLDSTIPLSTILQNARSAGLDVGADITSKGQLKTWLETRSSDIARGQTLNRLLGGSPNNNTELARIEQETIKANNAPSNIRSVVEEAAKRYGVDPDVAMRIAGIETGGTFNVRARNPKSTARGLFQVMADTWNGMNPNSQVSRRIDDSNPNDPRYNLEANADAGVRILKQNYDALKAHLGREPEGWELYLAHQQGLAGAKNLLGANADANAFSTIRPMYDSETDARNAISNNGGDWRTTTVGQFRDKWRRKWGDSASMKDGSSSAQTAEEALRSAAQQTRRQMEATAEGAKTIANTAKNLASRTLRNINEFMSDEQAEIVAVQISQSLKEVEDQTARYYDLKIEALTKYRDDVFSAGAMTSTEYDEITNQIADLQASKDNEMQRIGEETIASLTKMYRELPNSIGAIGKLFEEISQGLANLEDLAANSEERIALDYQTARDRVVGEVDQRQVAFGRMSNAEAEARATLRGRAIRNAAEAYQPRQMADVIAQSELVNFGLDRQLRNGSLTLRDVTSSRLETEKIKLASMDQTEREAYAQQNALVEELSENLSNANTLREKGRELTLETNALLEASAMSQASFGERANTILEGWAEKQGIFNSVHNDFLDGLPGVLDTAQSAFSTFFSDVMSGTASVGDAFRTMASAILKSMMDVVASAAAKQFMKMILNLATSIFGGTPTGHSLGGSIPTKYEGGFVRRAGGGWGAVRGRDSIPILAQPGEYILRKSAVEAIGADNLESLNAQGNRLTSGNAAPKSVTIAAPQSEAAPFNIYVVSPDNVPPPSRENIITWVQEDMINRGPIYKSTKAVQQGAI